MKLLRELLRAAFVGFSVLVVLGGLIASNAKDEHDVTRAAADLASEAPERLRSIYGIGLVGAVVGALTLLLLRVVAPGRRTKAPLAAFLAAFVATVCFAPGTLASGKVEDLAGVILVTWIAGFLVGLVDASRSPVLTVAGPNERI